MNKRTFLPRCLALMLALLLLPTLLLLPGCAGNAARTNGTVKSDTNTSATDTVTSTTDTVTSTNSSTDVTTPTENTGGEIADTTVGGKESGFMTSSKTQARPWVTATRGSGSTTTTAKTQSGTTYIYSKSALYNLVNYLTYKTDNYAIGVHLYGNLDVTNRIHIFEKHTGKTPAYVDFDMNSLEFMSSRTIQSAVSQLTDFVKSGGFVTITDHWLTPTTNIANASAGGANNSRGVLTRAQYYEVMTAGTTLNKNFLDELKIKANFLKMLRENGVPVIYRPLHEANGSWFWWGIHAEQGITGADVAKLYQYVERYFTETNGLDNILWEFCTAINGNQDVLCNWYPGDKYVDILSLDWYLPNLDYRYFNEKMTTECGKKPFAMSEFGGDGNYNASEHPVTETLSKLEAYLNQGAKVAYVGLYFDMGDKQNCTLSSRAITLDQMSGYWAKSRS